MKNVMLDLETFGLKPGSAIRSIGAVFFEFNGQTGPEFYANIDPKSCRTRGLTMEVDTVLWWSEQSPEARGALLANQLPLMTVAGGFLHWFKSNGGQYVWAQGAAFDPVLWEMAVGSSMVPWNYNDVRDTRTVYDLFPEPGGDTPSRIGTYHNALDDCKTQIARMARCLAVGRLPEKEMINE